MKRLLLAIVFVLLGTTAAFAEGLPVGFDGSNWKELEIVGNDRSLALKVFLVTGIYEGLSWGKCKDLKLYHVDTNYEHLVRSLDEFYRDYHNEKLFVTIALQIIAMELTGEPKKEIETTLRYWRKAVADMHEKKQ